MRTALLIAISFWSVIAMANDGSCKKPGQSPDQSWNPRGADVTPELRTFYDLGDKTRKLIDAKRFEEIGASATEYLVAANTFPCNWNFGNAIHDANSALGMRELERGNINGAKSYLLAAAQTTGSPQLNSFGPDPYLANALLKKGITIEVLEYLRSAGRFWEMNDGVVAIWIAEIQRGERPTLSRFEAMRLSVERKLSNPAAK